VSNAFVVNPRDDLTSLIDRGVDEKGAMAYRAMGIL
jgi:hypothetical protein